MIKIWRIVKAKYAREAFDGRGAKSYGGRWNHPGKLVVYASDSLPLAALELFVHLEGQPYFKLNTISANISANTEITQIEKLPKNWHSFPAPMSTKDIGSKWLNSNQTAVLKVPSVMIPDSYNYLLNPLHPNFNEIITNKPEPFNFDPKMWKNHS